MNSPFFYASVFLISISKILNFDYFLNLNTDCYLHECRLNLKIIESSLDFDMILMLHQIYYQIYSFSDYIFSFLLI